MKSEIEQFIQFVRMRSPQARTWRDYQCDLSLYMGVMGGRNVDEIRVRDPDEFVNHQTSRGFKTGTVILWRAAISCWIIEI
jgi:hypothetical protein